MAGQGGATPDDDVGLQYLIVLSGTDPLVWRRICVPSRYSFWDLHVAIQDVMGWEDSHLHMFRVLDPRSGTILDLGLPDPDGVGSESVAPVWTQLLIDFVAEEGPSMEYLYDFGDDWRHSIIFEDYSEPVEGPVCLGGGGACPPEDCGGPYGYLHLREVLSDPKHDEYEDMINWLGGPLDPPEYFSVDDVFFDNPEKRLKDLRDGGAL